MTARSLALLGAALLAALSLESLAPRPARAQGGAPPGAPAPEQAKKDKKSKKEKGENAAQGSSEIERKPPSVLFTSDEPLRLTLRADFKALFKNRDTLKVTPRPATLTFDPGGGAAPVTLGVALETRGHYRLKPSTCPFPPLRVVFDSAKTKGTPFAKQRALKLVTHCRNRNKQSEQYVLREYLAYRVYNLFTERSFRARRAAVTYVDARDTTDAFTEPAFFVESERDLARRNAGRIVTARGGKFEDFDRAQTDLLSVFEYFIGNTDFSLWALHNVRILGEPDGGYYPVPYDFDWSGAVDTYYAVPDPRLPIKTVRERIYRGPCRTAEEMAPVFQQFVAKRDTIMALYRGLEGLDRDYVKETEKYFAEFYATIADPREWKRASERACNIGA